MFQYVLRLHTLLGNGNSGLQKYLLVFTRDWQAATCFSWSVACQRL